MKTDYSLTGKTGMLLAIALMASPLQAHEAVDPLHSTPVEIVSSRLAEPVNIHVAETAQGIEVKGILQRRPNRKKKSLRGHLDIEIMDDHGQLVERSVLPVRMLPVGPARHDHRRDFFVVLTRPETKQFSLRVRHDVGKADHMESP